MGWSERKGARELEPRFILRDGSLRAEIMRFMDYWYLDIYHYSDKIKTITHDNIRTIKSIALDELEKLKTL